MMRPQEFPDTGQTRVGITCIQRRSLILGIHTHGTELIDVERTAETADALLFVNGRAVVLTPDQDIATQHERRENHKRYGRHDAIDDTLEIPLKSRHAVRDILDIARHGLHSPLTQPVELHLVNFR